MPQEELILRSSAAPWNRAAAIHISPNAKSCHACALPKKKCRRHRAREETIWFRINLTVSVRVRCCQCKVIGNGQIKDYEIQHGKVPDCTPVVTRRLEHHAVVVAVSFRKGRNESCQSLVGLLHDRWRHHLSPPPQFRHGTRREGNIFQPPAPVVSATTVHKTFRPPDLTSMYSVCIWWHRALNPGSPVWKPML
ncbi:uncharacterized protein TNCV_4428731 [Trichonephila clavipes]|nr:uncharacterized protein TNCV_4428731 [Trichonephila clavipes]